MKNGFSVVRTSLFGEFSRYKLVECIDRFGATWFHVEDGEVQDDFGLPSIIRQERIQAAAVAGLV